MNNAMTDEKRYLFFWSNNSPYSNWYGSKFEIDQVEFNCAEQAMMYLKAVLFEDDETADKVMKTKNPKEQKALGRSVRNFDQAIWENHREDIMFDILFAKFSQNEELKDALMSTEGMTLVESSPYDRIWGIGMREGDSDIHDETKWRGLNLLGKALMRVRETLFA